MKKIYVFLVSLLMALCARAASDTLYLFGELAGGWSPSEGIEMIKTAPGVFTIDVTVVGEKYFAFVDKLGETLDELNAHRYSPASSEAVPVVGENDMVIGVEGGCWKISTGKYKFTVNTNANKFILSDKGPLDLYLRGDVNCWEIGDNYKFTPISQNVYTLGGVTLNAGEQFKIADANWNQELQFTSGYLDMAVNAIYSYQEHGYNNMAMGERVENATIILNLIDKTIIVLRDAPSGDQELYLRGGMNSWGIDDDYKFTTVDGCVYTLTGVTLNAGEHFKISDPNWVLQFTSGHLDMMVNTTYSYQDHTYNNMAMAKTVENATVILNLINRTINVLCNAPSGDQELYLRGNMNSWGIDDDYKFTSTNGYVYTLNGVTLNAGEDFKIADPNWTLQFTSGYRDMVVNAVYSYQEHIYNNMAMAETVENATVILNLNNKTIKVLSDIFFVAPETLYLIGDLKDNHWDPANPVEMTKTGNGFSLNDIEIEASDGNYGYFSFCTAKGDWNSIGKRYGATFDSEGILPDTPSRFVSGGNPWKILPGKYDVEINFDTNRVTLKTETDAIEAIVAEDGEAAVYFNMQGIRVPAPEAGAPYIVKRGNRISKEIAR